jgi:hypothetical protein
VDRSRQRVTIALNCIAKKRPFGVWHDVEINAHDDPREVAQRCLGAWYIERAGHLVPLASRPNRLIPDEVVVWSQRGDLLARWNIDDEMNARFAKRS